VRRRLRTVSREDLGECFDEASCLVSAAATLLELEQVEPAVEEPAVVGELGVELVTHAAAIPQRFDRNLSEVTNELGIGDLVDSAAILFQGDT
jgi:hypothetical protein